MPNDTQTERPTGGESNSQQVSTEETPWKAERRPIARTIAAKYALVVLWALMAGYFLIRIPDTFGTTGTLRAIFGSQQALVLVILGMAVLITLVVGEFDLSIASTMALSATVIAVLGGQHDVNIVLACLAGLACGALVGLVNAILVLIVGVSSFVVTLGMATFLAGLAQYISNNTYVAVSSGGLNDFVTTSVLGMPAGFYYGIAVAVFLAYVLAWTPLGRSMSFIGANAEVARLAGINVKAIKFGAYVAGGTISGFAGLLVVAAVGSFDNSTSGTYLLAAIAAVFLGTAVVQPGVPNPIGTLIAIYFLQTGIFGLQLLGFDTWIQNVFYGGGLVAAVVVAKIVRSRSTRV